MVIIHKKDKQKMSDMVEDILYTAGRLMTCVEDMEEMDEMGERRNYGDRYGMGMRDGGRYGMRDWEDDPMMERHRYRRY